MGTVSRKVCAITGAGGGIGREVALELARRGACVAISDVDEAGLAQTGELLAPVCPDVHRHVLDVSDRPAVEAWADTVAGHYGVVHQIYNNAGVASGHTILESGYAELEGVIAIDLWGVIYGTKAFLPHVIASGDGHVVNTSSLNGYLAQGKLSAYVTSKFAVRGFTETLRAEMLAARSPVKVSVVHPGGIKTQISHNAMAYAERVGIEVTHDDRARAKLYSDKYLRMDPGRAARIIVDGVEKGRPRILVGSDAKVVDAIVRLMPATAPRLGVLLDRLTAASSSRRG